MLQTVEFVWRTSHSFVRIFLKLLYHRTVVLVEFCAVIGITFISWPTNIKWGSVSKKEFFFLNSWEHEFYNECSFLLDCMNWSLMTVKWGIHYYIFIVLLVMLSFISTSHLDGGLASLSFFCLLPTRSCFCFRVSPSLPTLARPSFLHPVLYSFACSGCRPLSNFVLSLHSIPFPLIQCMIEI